MIQWSRVEELKEDFGTDEFQEVIEIFLSEVEEAIARLPEAIKPEEKSDSLHFIKGSALNLGFETLAGLCDPLSADGTFAAPEDVAACYYTSKATFLADPRIA